MKGIKENSFAAVFSSPFRSKCSVSTVFSNTTNVCSFVTW
jgi:hypothetical protein